MLKNIISIFFFLFILINPLFASVEDKIINNLIKTNNLNFNFKQTIGEKTEEGNCTIEYPKKIFCLYNNYNKKIVVSNGKSLASLIMFLKYSGPLLIKTSLASL